MASTHRDQAQAEGAEGSSLQGLVPGGWRLAGDEHSRAGGAQEGRACRRVCRWGPQVGEGEEEPEFFPATKVPVALARGKGLSPVEGSVCRGPGAELGRWWPCNGASPRGGPA